MDKNRSACARKIAYDTRQKAKAACRRFSRFIGDKGMAVYRCKGPGGCGQFHVGHHRRKR